MNRPRFSAIFSILVLAAGSLAVCMYFGRGVSLADQETKLRRSILAEPGNSTASMELARILSQKQAWPESVVTLQEALKHAPGDLDLNRQLAVVYGDWFDGTQDLKKLSKAVKHLEQVVDSGKAAATDYEMLAARQFSAGNHIRAAEAYAEAAKRAPQDLRLLEHVHYAGYMAGQYEKSLAFFKNLTENAPKNDWAWQMRGIIEYHVGKYDDAVSSLEKSLALATAANRKSAQENLEYALRLQSKERTKSNFYAHYGMATTHFKKSRADRAAAEYEAAVSISTEYKKQAAWAYAWMADFATYMSNDDQALEYAQRAVELARQINDPNDLSFKYQQLASIYTQKAIREKDKFNDYMEKSIEAHEQQLEYCRRARNRHMEIHALADLALTLVKRDGVEGEKAKCYRAEMAAFLPKAGQPIDCATASVLAAEGWFCKYEQDYAGAEESLKPAAEYYAQSTDARDAKHGPYLYAELAALAYRRNDYDLGIQYGERAAELLSRLRSLLGADEFRQKVGGETWRDTFKVLIKCAFEKRDTRAVFNYCEQYKAQALLELLGSRA